MSTIIAYLQVDPTAGTGGYSITEIQAKQLAAHTTFFDSLLRQWSSKGIKSGNTQQPPLIQVPLPSPQHFDPLLTWFYQQNDQKLQKYLVNGGPDAFFGIVKNAVQLGTVTDDNLWDFLAHHVALEWLGSFKNHPQWVATIVPITLAAKAAIAIGGGTNGGNMVGKWAGGDVAMAKRALEEVKRSIQAYQDDGDDNKTIVEPESPVDGGPPQQLAGPPLLEQKKKKRGFLSRLADLVIKNEQVHIATMVIVRDSKGNIIDERINVHEKGW